MDNARRLLDQFRTRFGTSATIYRAPGRVNLIGEHTDYNEGFVLPAAIGFSCWVAIAPRNERKLAIYSEIFEESVEADLDRLSPAGGGKWSDYPLGVASALERSGKRLRGANLYVSGDVPLGSGLSSSAALEVASGYALLAASGNSVDLKQLALACQRAENEFVGARSGIMDQFISCYGRKGQALLLDCRSLEFRFLPLPAGIHLVICNTMVKHELGASEYNTRRAECEAAVRALAGVLPGIRSLRDVTLVDLERHRSRLSETLYRRCRHVITENERVLRTAQAFGAGDVAGLGPVMAESHRSLRDDYEVSCRELDVMVEIASRQPGVYGARMTGGGFGGCTINLVDSRESQRFQRTVCAEYERAAGIQPDIYICAAAKGAGRVEMGVEHERIPSD